MINECSVRGPAQIVKSVDTVPELNRRMGASHINVVSASLSGRDCSGSGSDVVVSPKSSN